MRSWVGIARSPTLDRTERSRFARVTLHARMAGEFVPLATSYSYCREIVGIAATEGPSIGIDLEVVDERSVENALLACPEISTSDPCDPLRAWCAKEALVKFMGTGFQDEPARHPVQYIEGNLWRHVDSGRTVHVQEIVQYGVRILLAVCAIEGPDFRSSFF